MKIEITCDENATFMAALEVRSLDFDSSLKVFYMRVIMGDDWLGQKMHCPMSATPVSVRMDQEAGRVNFEHYKDAAAFGHWLIDGDAQVEHGFRTMRG